MKDEEGGTERKGVMGRRKDERCGRREGGKLKEGEGRKERKLSVSEGWTNEEEECLGERKREEGGMRMEEGGGMR